MEVVDSFYLCSPPFAQDPRIFALFSQDIVPLSSLVSLIIIMPLT